MHNTYHDFNASTSRDDDYASLTALAVHGSLGFSDPVHDRAADDDALASARSYHCSSSRYQRWITSCYARGSAWDVVWADIRCNRQVSSLRGTLMSNFDKDAVIYPKS